MTSIQKFLSSWHKLISDGQIEIAYEQLKSEIAEQKWTIDQENKMANYCLVCTNMKTYEFYKKKVKDQSMAQQIFRMTDFCCRIIGKTWKCKVPDFIGCLRVICEYFLASDSVYEALVISQYRTEFVHVHNERESSKDENTKITDDMVLFYLHHLHKMPMNDLEVILDIWKFVLSPKVIEVTSSNISSILLSFGNFCSRANSTEGVKSSLLIMWYLSEIPLANFTEKDIDIFVYICEIIIRHLKTDQLKKNISKLICNIEQMTLLYRSGELPVISFCCDILRFSVCRCDSSNPSILVENCCKGLDAVLSASSMLCYRAANFARLVLVHAQNYWLSGENFFYRKFLPNVFTFFTKLSEILKRMEISQNNTSERKYCAVLSLAILITNRVPDLSKEELISIYFHVKESISMLLETYDDDCGVDNAYKTQLFNNIGVLSSNVGCLYMKAKLYSECEEVSLMAIEKIAALSNDVVLNCSLQLYVEKLTICLFRSQKYESALRTTCTWAAKLPQSRTTFMSRYATFKATILYDENQEKDTLLLNKTCWDLIEEEQQKNSSTWEKINLTDRDIMILLHLELKYFLAHQIHSVDRLENYENELFIFTQSSDFLNECYE
ncbi:uncharacterized protein LOC135834345 [Planococcus citri]|uniref:uncharacterized protein LOC135834345 n=1 Tax=Planococcus citri TaxID=170843 RepID=UPI0031F8FC8E